MTESEARSKIKYRIETARQIAGNGVDGKAFEDLEIAVQVLKEIREYRAIGTVEEFKALKDKNEPKKVEYVEYRKEEGEGYPFCECGKCLIVDFVRVKYCPACGQKLDWKGGAE